MNVKSLIKNKLTFVNDYLHATKVSVIVLYHLTRYVFLGDYDSRMIDLIHSLSEQNMLYVKMFQALAGSNDFLSEKVQDYLTIFSDSAPYKDTEEDYEMMCDYIDDVGKKHPEYKITNISAKPIHSGTVSLVYDGNMGDKEVVIKYVRNGIKQTIEQSIKEMDIIIKIVSLVPNIKSLNLGYIFKENIPTLLEQTSMKNELLNITQVREKILEYDYEYIKVPEPYSVFTQDNDSILVMEKLVGRRIDEIEEDEKEIYGMLLAKQAINAIMNIGMYHNDLHIGNILFLKEDDKHKLGLLDFGIISRLTETEQLTLSSFYLSLGMGMFEDAANILVNTFGNKQILEKMDSDKRVKLLDELSNIIKNTYNNSDGMSIGYVSQINSLLNKNDLTLPPVFCRIEIALAMNVSLNKMLETKNRNFVSYIHEVISEKLDLNIYEV